MIEVLTVIALLAIISAIGLLISFDTYRGSSFRSDRNLLIASLERARAEAISNVCLGSGCTNAYPHGVHIQSDKYVIFQGSAYNSGDANNAPFAANTVITKTPSSGPLPLDIVFSALSGTTTGSIITLSDPSHSSIITVTTEGRITWTN
jgi:Tfp pilus assembly protein FimT